MAEQIKELSHFLDYFHSRNEVHIIRKLWHIGVGLMCLWPYYHVEFFTAEILMYTSFAAATLGLFVDLLRIRWKGFNHIILRVMRPLIRRGEVNSVTGLPYYGFGMALALYFYQEEIAILAIYFLVFSDPISSYFGIRYGTNKLIANKSVQGSAAGLCTCYGISLIYGLAFSGPTNDLLVFSLLAGVVGCLSELCSVLIDDNLAIPLISGGGLTLLNMAYPIY